MKCEQATRGDGKPGFINSMADKWGVSHLRVHPIHRKGG